MNLGRPEQFLSIKLDRSKEKAVGTIQTNLTKKLLGDNGMTDARPVSTPTNAAMDCSKYRRELDENESKRHQSIVGSLMYLAQKMTSFLGSQRSSKVEMVTIKKSDYRIIRKC